MIRPHFTETALGALFLLPALPAFAAIAGCGQELRCTGEVADGRSIYQASVIGRRPEGELRHEAIRTACTKLCAAGDEPGEECASRCAVDVEAGKLGGRTTCSGAP
ncbi:MAG: hypothetical protein U0359_38335 [Byssovorax sp.]